MRVASVRAFYFGNGSTFAPRGKCTYLTNDELIDTDGRRTFSISSRFCMRVWMHRTSGSSESVVPVWPKCLHRASGATRLYLTGFYYSGFLFPPFVLRRHCLFNAWLV